MNIRKLKDSLIFSIILVLIFSFLAFNTSFAQERNEAADLREFKDMAVEVEAENTEAVNKLQLFWHNLKDTINLALTFDETKKIEKKLQYAEKRIRWANTLSTLDSQEKKDLAFELSAKADEYINEIADKSNHAFKEVSEREEKILENILIHQENKAQVWKNLESDIAVENSEGFMRIREQIESKQEEFMKNLSINNEIPGYLREDFQGQAQKAKQRRENRKNFIERNREQLNNLNTSNNSDLKEFLEKRRQDMMEFNQEFQEEFEDIPNEASQNRNIQRQQENRSRLQSQSSENNELDSSGDNLDMPPVDINSPEYQEFLRMLDSSQSVTDNMEALE
ncbi:MAG: hypothetical protein ACLFNO_03825 [Parcubacteria group bacterium]